MWTGYCGTKKIQFSDHMIKSCEELCVSVSVHHKAIMAEDLSNTIFWSSMAYMLASQMAVLDRGEGVFVIFC